MDPHWLPWCWGAGAAGCAAIFFAVQPWREEFRQGFALVRKYPAAWAVPVGLAVVDGLAVGWAGRVPQLPESGAGRWSAMALAQAWQGMSYGPAVALLGVVLVLFNVAGLRQGFLKGVDSVMGRGGRAALALLAAGALALVADAALAGREVAPGWHMAVSILAIPAVGWPAAAVLAGLLLLAETESRAPEKVAEVRWMESAAAHTARLWPWALGHGLGWWLGRWLPGPAEEVAGWVAAAVGGWMAFAPAVFLHVKHGSEWRGGLARALGLWRSCGWQPLAWGAVAGMVFFLWFQAGKGLAGLVADAPDGLRIVLACGHGIVHIGLTVGMLGTWMSFRTAGQPLPRPQRPRAATPP